METMAGWEDYLEHEAPLGRTVGRDTYVACPACRTEAPAARQEALRAGQKVCAKHLAYSPLLRSALQLGQSLAPPLRTLGGRGAFKDGPHFKEVFAGTARITQAVKALGIRTVCRPAAPQAEGAPGIP